MTISKNDVIKSRPLNSISRDRKYPQKDMPFYLYGTPKKMHISHVLLRSPNIALSAANVQLSAVDKNSPDPEKYIHANDLASGLILALTDFRETVMQPFPERASAHEEEAASGNEKNGSNGASAQKEDTPPVPFFFRDQQKFSVSVWKDPKQNIAKGPGLLAGLGDPIWKGKLTLGPDLDFDSVWPNKDPTRSTPDPSYWRDELSKIPNVLNAKYKD